MTESDITRIEWWDAFTEPGPEWQSDAEPTKGALMVTTGNFFDETKEGFRVSAIVGVESGANRQITFVPRSLIKRITTVRINEDGQPKRCTVRDFRKGKIIKSQHSNY